MNLHDNDRDAIWNAIDGLLELADWIETHGGSEDRAEMWRETADHLRGLMNHIDRQTDKEKSNGTV